MIDVKQSAKDLNNRTRDKRNKFLMRTGIPLIIGCMIGSYLTSYFSNDKVEASSQPEARQAVLLAQTIDNKVQEPEFTFFVEPTYYDPSRATYEGMEQNADNDPTHTSTGVRILKNDLITPVSDYWFNPETNSGGVACPKEHEGRTIEAELEGGERITLYCIDTGGMIKQEGNVMLIDILWDDGLEERADGWNVPISKNGELIKNSKTYPARFLD